MSDLKTYDDFDSAIAAEKANSEDWTCVQFLAPNETGTMQHWKLTRVSSEEISQRARKDFKDGCVYISKDDEIIGFVAL